jgi:hypothetical protein
MKKPQYSFSRIDIYSRCPWAYRTIYLDKIPRAKSDALEIGTTLHDLVADYLNRLIVLGHPTDWEWARGATPKNGIEDVGQIWQQFYETFTLPQCLDAPGVEKQLAFDRMWQPCEYFSDEAYFRMVIDFHFRQDSLGVIVDWKTNRQVPQTVEKDMQLLTYGWGLKEALYPDVQEVLLRLHFLRYSREREILLTPEDLSDVPAMLTTRIEMIEADTTFNPTPGSFCGWCGITAHCPVMAEALVPAEVLAPATREQAEKAASLLMTLQRMEKDIAVRIKEWVKENGAIQVGDLVYGPTPVVSYNLDAQQVVQTLIEAGLSREEVWPLISITKTNLEKGLRKLRRGDLLELTLSAETIKVSEKVEFKKASLAQGGGISGGGS